MARRSLEYKGDIFEISYEVVHPAEKVDIVILHGWGSNKGLMKRSFSPYMTGFRHIYIDLPGFGNSTAPCALTSYDVAAIMEIFFQETGIEKHIILGHSFGGKVALLLRPKLLVLVASAGIYMPKPLVVKGKIAFFKFLKIFGLSKFRSLFVAQDAKELSPEMYETFKTVVNEDMRDEFAKFPNKAALFWGREDTATPLESAHIMQELLKDATLEVYDGDHYFFMKHAKDISQKIEHTFLNIGK